MAKKFKTPTLADIVYQYLGMHQQRARLADYEKLQNMYLKRLQRVDDPTAIRASLALDTHRHLPVQMRSPAYERLLAIEGRSVTLLREYAQEMYEFGEDFLPYADRLWDEAKRLEDQERA